MGSVLDDISATGVLAATAKPWDAGAISPDEIIVDSVGTASPSPHCNLPKKGLTTSALSADGFLLSLMCAVWIVGLSCSWAFANSAITRTLSSTMQHRNQKASGDLSGRRQFTCHPFPLTSHEQCLNQVLLNDLTCTVASSQESLQIS